MAADCQGDSIVALVTLETEAFLVLLLSAESQMV